MIGFALQEKDAGCKADIRRRMRKLRMMPIFLLRGGYNARCRDRSEGREDNRAGCVSRQPGYFFESFNLGKYREAGITDAFVQDNVSMSFKGVLRGLHLQNPTPQGKLVTVLSGAVIDVAVDVRLGSPTFGKHVAVHLDGASHRQLWIPRGFAHGFIVLSDEARFMYKCDAPWDRGGEIGIRWNDPDIEYRLGHRTARCLGKGRGGTAVAGPDREAYALPG